MSAPEICDRHAWASVGVVTRDGSVARIWECEQCPVWTTQRFDPVHELAWADTWLADR